MPIKVCKELPWSLPGGGNILNGLVSNGYVLSLVGDGKPLGRSSLGGGVVRFVL